MSAVLFHRIIRWSLGSLFLGAGIYYFNEGAWPAIVFGVLMVVTGFFKPRRCVDDNCEI
jgi:hypothetical protein